MCSPALAIGAGIGIWGVGTAAKSIAAYKQTKAENQALSYKAQLLDKNAEITAENAKFAEEQAIEVIKQGMLDEQAFRRQLSQLQGNTRVAYAHAGVVVDFGTTFEVALETAKWGEYDALAIKHNAEQAAKGYEMQAKNLYAQAEGTRGEANLARMGIQSPGTAAGMSLLTSGLNLGGQVAGMATRYYLGRR